MFDSGRYALAMGLALALGTSIGARAVGQAPEPVRGDTAGPNETLGVCATPSRWATTPHEAAACTNPIVPPVTEAMVRVGPALSHR